ncbi:IS21-like element helper ATPase IstB [Flavobacterium johnsoniae]|uniref:DNA replication protein DnaC n=4 Tax=Flavobacterium TaxID=237 RepID=A0A1M5WDB6_FLAJO|nr:MULTISPECIES: IS21-like element helper ATPase IstB [Flavobacterium]MBW1658644.1 ATP-binding protein [Flavobacterium quisquiliarum]MBZ4035267.1 IS21-like element helper ATPase IstB [Flavobacterium potami]RXM45495.1 ATP-binding protein [Flavobacterium sp. YO64]RXM49540.1 ATP-binding protein [Flavobacterium sp. YO12]WJS93478.1 IS21-like element helper ATPase IstB [Flavobacterium johnsoniae]
MNESTVAKMKQMKLHGMHNAFMTAIESGKTDHYTIDQFMSMIIDAEWDERHNRRIERSITNALFHYKSNIESINFDQSRNIDRNLILRLAECSFVEKNENILITGSTGVGKSFLGTALGYQACIEGYRVSYFNTAKLFAKLKMAKADGTYLRELMKIQRQDVIILDDFGLQALDSQNRITLLEIIEDRHNNGSIIVTSQIPVQGWYDIIGEKTIADAILDRLIHQAHRVELHGESMRKKKSIIKE